MAKDNAPLTGFYISASTTSNFVAATAEIDGNSVLVYSAQVSSPLAVRYAFEPDPVPNPVQPGKPPANLYNAEGLPALPFRTNVSLQDPEGQPVRIQCSADHPALSFDGASSATISAVLYDTSDTRLFSYRYGLTFSISGAGTWADGGTGNKTATVGQAIDGVAQVSVKPTGAGTITVRANYGGLAEGVASITVTTAAAGGNPEPFPEPAEVSKCPIVPGQAEGTVQYTLDEPGYVSINIYTLTGELVRSLFAGNLSASGSMNWEGENDAGKAVANGIYVVKIKLPSGTYTKKFAVIKR